MTKPSSLEIFGHLHALLHAFKTQMLERLATQHPELTFVEMRLLMLTGQTPGIAQKALVEVSRIDKAQMTRTLAVLEMGGWLERLANPEDKRGRCLQLSAQGQALYQQLIAWESEIADAMFGDWPEVATLCLQASAQQCLLASH